MDAVHDANHQSQHLVDQLLSAAQLWAYGVCQFVQGWGGAIANDNDKMGHLQFTSCSFSGNRAKVSLRFLLV